MVYRFISGGPFKSGKTDVAQSQDAALSEEGLPAGLHHIRDSSISTFRRESGLPLNDEYKARLKEGLSPFVESLRPAYESGPSYSLSAQELVFDPVSVFKTFFMPITGIEKREWSIPGVGIAPLVDPVVAQSLEIGGLFSKELMLGSLESRGYSAITTLMRDGDPAQTPRGPPLQVAASVDNQRKAYCQMLAEYPRAKKILASWVDGRSYDLKLVIPAESLFCRGQTAAAWSLGLGEYGRVNSAVLEAAMIADGLAMMAGREPSRISLCVHKIDKVVDPTGLDVGKAGNAYDMIGACADILGVPGQPSRYLRIRQDAREEAKIALGIEYAPVCRALAGSSSDKSGIAPLETYVRAKVDESLGAVNSLLKDAKLPMVKMPDIYLSSAFLPTGVKAMSEFLFQKQDIC